MILGIDVGGTHTDAVLIDHFTVLKKAKVPTRDNDLLSSLLDVTNELLTESTLKSLQKVVLSTTLSTNAIVQNKIDRVGLLLASGPGLPPSLLGINEDAFFLSGSINHRGVEILEIDRSEAERAVELCLFRGINHLGIVGKFSTRNPNQELALADVVGDRLHHITLGHSLSGHLNFPRRIATAYLNEAIWDRYHRFVDSVLHFARNLGIDVPIYILKADGGTFPITQSTQFPVQTILSGPAASIMGIVALTGCASDAIALDIGGTTTDIALFVGGVPLLEPLGVTIEGRKTLIRGLRTRSIGVGGDSVVRLRGGTLRIGPDREGPAAAFGGPLPTPTDAMIVLGLSGIGNREMATEAIRPIALGLNCTIVDAAAVIFRETVEKIAGHVRQVMEEANNQPVYTIHELLEGRQIEPKVLYVVGGPAGPIAPELGRLLGCEVKIPDHAEVANAIGAALARTTAELTLLADTERRIMTIAEEGLQIPIPAKFTKEDAIAAARAKLREKVSAMGDLDETLEIEVIEALEFNMVRDFYTTGKNIRVKVQIKPGTVSGFTPGDAACQSH